MATNFWKQFAITAFVCYNFSCMTASDTLFDSMGGFSGSSYLASLPLRFMHPQTPRTSAHSDELVRLTWLFLSERTQKRVQKMKLN